MAHSKERDKLASDADCVLEICFTYTPGDGTVRDASAVCKTHGQPLVDCANGRMKQVKQAREMAERRLSWALAWKATACKTREEINKLYAKSP